MKNIRSIRELELMQQKLKMQEELDAKNLTDSSSRLIHNISDNLRDIAFEAGAAVALNLFRLIRKDKRNKK